MCGRFILRKKRKNTWCELGHFLCLHTCHESQLSQGQQYGISEERILQPPSQLMFFFSCLNELGPVT